MKVDKSKDGLLIVPETEFEERMLAKMYPHGKSYSAFLKCGMTPSEIIGVKIYSAEGNRDEED